MTFDASGSRVRLDSGSLITDDGTTVTDWWGQIDLRRGALRGAGRFGWTPWWGLSSGTAVCS
jgi:hypothetical protein